MRLKKAIKALTPQFLHPPSVADRMLRRMRRSDRVFDGPFRGMRFTWDAWDANFTLPIPKFLGTYELELHGVIERVCAAAPERIIDVGAAEGYYAVGLALRVARAHVVAFEELDGGREAIARLAETNGAAGRVQALGHCELDDLAMAMQRGGRTFVMMDVEGFERTLLDPDRIPALRDAMILVEAHDCYSPGVADELARRFSGSHRIERIESRVPSLTDIKCIGFLRKHYIKYSALGWMGELLYPLTWLYMEPKEDWLNDT